MDEECVDPKVVKFGMGTVEMSLVGSFLIWNMLLESNVLLPECAREQEEDNHKS